MASTNLTSFAYDLETVPGTTNATPDFSLLPVLSNTVASNITTNTSQAIVNDRMTTDLIVTDKDVGGDVGFELSYTAWKPLLTSLMQNSSTGSVAETACTAVSAGNLVQKSGLDAVLAIGDVIRLSSITDTLNNGIYIVTDNTTSDEVTISPNFPDTPSGATDYVVGITTSVKNGASTPDSYSLRTIMQDNSGTPYYHYARGMQVNSASINFATGSIIDGSFNFVGLTEEATATQISGETSNAIAAYEVLSGASSVGTVTTSGGISLGTCSFSNISLNVTNNINSQKSIGTLGACGLSSFSLEVTLDATIYFTDLTNYNAFLNSTAFTISFFVEDGAGTLTNNAIGFSLRNCKFNSLTTSIGGKDAFLEEQANITALKDTTTNSAIQLFFIDAT